MTEEANQQVQEQAQAAPEKTPMPPEIQKEFNKIYKELKTTKERNSLLEKHSLDLTNALAGVQKATKDTQVKSVMSDLRQQLREARELGDEKLVESLEDKITDLKVEEKLEKKVQPKPPAQQPQVEQPYYELTKSEIRIIESWSNEVDEDDEPVRPWASNPNHPKAQKAYEYLTEVLEDEDNADLTIKEKLALVDEKFLRKAKTTRDINAVGEGSLTKTKTAQQDKLSDDEKRIAWRIFSKLPQDKAEQAYLDGKKAMKG